MAGGFLTGKYRPTGETPSGEGRLSDPGNPGKSWTDRDWALLKPLEKVADELGGTMAQVAINWVETQPGVAAAIVGASAVPPESVYRIFTAEYQNWVVSGVKIGDKPAGYAPEVRNW
ncbi:aldo/keto reductase [Amycolatopsis japonica]|uniref:aldo/keto reductase n=1 Tax=Amycolatopsis japonica TaxID=208439 RepID=UPI00340BE83F